MTVNETRKRLIITDGRIVTPTTVCQGSVVIEAGVITEVTTHRYVATSTKEETVVGVGGRYVLPGIVCLHNDGQEKALNPRPKTNFPPDFALLAYDRELAGAGITTQFHAVYFAPLAGMERGIDGAIAMAHAISDFATSSYASLDHFLLLRCEVRTPGSLDAVLTCLDLTPTCMISVDDHVPGRGQYRHVAQHPELVTQHLEPGKPADEAMAAWLVEREARARETELHVAALHKQLARASREHDVTLVSHDDDTVEKVTMMQRLGAQVAEFPVTIEAAQQAHELGMWVSMGAPNVVRGGSLMGNVSARVLAQHGLLDILISDYHASSMLYAAFLLAKSGIVSLPKAVAMITATPATAAGLGDRGALVPGLRADVIVVEMRGTIPVVMQQIFVGSTKVHFGEYG